VQISSATQVVLRLNTPWRDGSTHLLLSALEFMRRTARTAVVNSR